MSKYNFFFQPIELLLILLLFIILVFFGYCAFWGEDEPVTEFLFTPTSCEQQLKECVDMLPLFIDEQTPKPMSGVTATE